MSQLHIAYLYLTVELSLLCFQVEDVPLLLSKYDQDALTEVL